MMRTTLTALTIAAAISGCTANPAAHIFLREQAAARSVGNDDRQERTPAIVINETPVRETQAALRIVDEPEEPAPVAEREPDPGSSEREAPPQKEQDTAPEPEPKPEAPVEEPEPIDETPAPEPEEIEPEPVEDKPNPHPACRRATPPPFC